jgi:DNA-binding response OmpR family regulator
MKDEAEKVLVVESDDGLREHIVAVLRDAGYEVSTDSRGGLKAVVAFNPSTVVLCADPPQLDCCDLRLSIQTIREPASFTHGLA